MHEKIVAESGNSVASSPSRKEDGRGWREMSFARIVKALTIESGQKGPPVIVLWSDDPFHVQPL